MGFLRKGLPTLSSGARDFIREHPREARMAVAVALETAARNRRRSEGHCRKACRSNFDGSS